jgi:two-component system sensor histidine kinase YesM
MQACQSKFLGRICMLYTLRARLVVTFAILLIIPLVAIVLLFTKVSNNVLGDSIESSVSQTMDQNAAFVNQFTSQVDDVANQILSSDVAQTWLNAQMENELSTASMAQLNGQLREYLASIALNHSTVSSVSVFNENGKIIGIQDQGFMDPAFIQNDWYLRFKNGDHRWSAAHLDIYQPNYLKDDSVNSLIYPLVLLRNFKGNGLIKVNFPTNSIKDPLEKIQLSQTGRVYLLNWQGTPVLSQNIQHHGDIIGQGLKEAAAARNQASVLSIRTGNQTYKLFYRKLKVEDWVLIGLLPEKELFQKLTDLQYLLLGMGLVLLAVTIIVAIAISSSIARPLTKLAKAMKLVERGDFVNIEQRLPQFNVTHSEIGFVIGIFQNIVRKLKHLIETEFQANLQRRDSEYKALLMQINPHFLYNTLEVMSSLAVQKRSEGVIEVAEALGLMLRYSMKMDSDLVMLKQELQYIRYYISILQIRFGTSLQIDIQDDPSIHDVLIIKFILQPIVENAVKYSRGHAKPAIIKLVLKRNRDQLEIIVEDNGIGMSEAQIASILEQPSSQTFVNVLTTDGKSIGLRNVLARCRLYYGSRFEIEIASALGTGTRLIFHLPISEVDSNVSSHARG